MNARRAGIIISIDRIGYYGLIALGIRDMVTAHRVTIHVAGFISY